MAAHWCLLATVFIALGSGTATSNGSSSSEAVVLGGSVQRPLGPAVLGRTVPGARADDVTTPQNPAAFVVLGAPQPAPPQLPPLVALAVAPVAAAAVPAPESAAVAVLPRAESAALAAAVAPGASAMVPVPAGAKAQAVPVRSVVRKTRQRVSVGFQVGGDGQLSPVLGANAASFSGGAPADGGDAAVAGAAAVAAAPAAPAAPAAATANASAHSTMLRRGSLGREDAGAVAHIWGKARAVGGRYKMEVDERGELRALNTSVALVEEAVGGARGASAPPPPDRHGAVAAARGAADQDGRRSEGATATSSVAATAPALVAAGADSSQSGPQNHAESSAVLRAAGWPP